MSFLDGVKEYIAGVEDFLNKTFITSAQGDEILCPCRKCSNRYWHCRNIILDHLVYYGFLEGHDHWVFHEEGFSSRMQTDDSLDGDVVNTHDDIDGLLNDMFKNIDGRTTSGGAKVGPNSEAQKFYKLIEEEK